MAIRKAGASLVLLIVAVVCFILAAIGIKVDVNLVDIGLAAFAAAFIFA